MAESETRLIAMRFDPCAPRRWWRAVRVRIAFAQCLRANPPYLWGARLPSLPTAGSAPFGLFLCKNLCLCLRHELHGFTAELR